MISISNLKPTFYRTQGVDTLPHSFASLTCLVLCGWRQRQLRASPPPSQPVLSKELPLVYEVG